MPETHGPSVEPDFAAPGRLARAEKRLQEFRAARPHQAGDTEDLAGMKIERDVLQPVAPRMVGPGKREPTDCKHRAATRSIVVKGMPLDLTAHHPPGDLAG